MIILQFSLHHLRIFSLRGWENVLFIRETGSYLQTYQDASEGELGIGRRSRWEIHESKNLLRITTHKSFGFKKQFHDSLEWWANCEQILTLTRCKNLLRITAHNRLDSRSNFMIVLSGGANSAVSANFLRSSFTDRKLKGRYSSSWWTTSTGTPVSTDWRSTKS